MCVSQFAYGNGIIDKLRSNPGNRYWLKFDRSVEEVAGSQAAAIKIKYNYKIIVKIN